MNAITIEGLSAKQKAPRKRPRDVLEDYSALVYAEMLLDANVKGFSHKRVLCDAERVFRIYETLQGTFEFDAEFIKSARSLSKVLKPYGKRLVFQVDPDISSFDAERHA